MNRSTIGLGLAAAALVASMASWHEHEAPATASERASTAVASPARADATRLSVALQALASRRPDGEAAAASERSATAEPVASPSTPGAPAEPLADTPADADVVADLAERFPQLERQLTAYRESVAVERERVSEFERRMAAVNRAVREGRAVPEDTAALDRERDHLLERARALGRQAMVINQGIRDAVEAERD
jgi:hypothetical protein